MALSRPEITRDSEREPRRAQQTAFQTTSEPLLSERSCFRCDKPAVGLAQMHPLDRTEPACADHATPLETLPAKHRECCEGHCRWCPMSRRDQVADDERDDFEPDTNESLGLPVDAGRY